MPEQSERSDRANRIRAHICANDFISGVPKESGARKNPEAAELASMMHPLFLPKSHYEFKSDQREKISAEVKKQILSDAASSLFNPISILKEIDNIFYLIDYYSDKCSDYYLRLIPDKAIAIKNIYFHFMKFLSGEVESLNDLSKIIEQSGPTKNLTSEFNDLDEPDFLCIPEDGIAVPYPGKKVAGDIRKYLESTYPYRDGAEPLSLGWLEKADPKGYRALYNQSSSETGSPSSFLPSMPKEGDAILEAYGVNLHTPEGLKSARRLYGLLSSRLYPRVPRR